MKQSILPILLILLFAFSNVSLISDTRPEKRIALVIGNSNYDEKELDLKNPVNDAQEMKKALEAVGFEVAIVKNGSKTTMRKALNAFDKKNQAIDKRRYKAVALFYYSGHGMHVNNTNYIIPTDASIQSPADLDEFAISSDWIVNRMDVQSNYLSLLMFDACRDNPLTKSMAAYFKRKYPSKSSAYDPPLFAGLAKKEKVSTGVIVSYAADAGEKADSGDRGGTTSPYLAAYLTHIQTPNLPIETLFRKIGNDVVTQSRDTQHPTLTNRFYKEFMFKKIEKPVETPKDYDGDGVPDDKDQCPTKYARTTNGCPDSDLPKMVKVEGGSFQMGSNEGADNEKPVHTVNVPTFWMGQYEVTNEQFATFLNAKGNQKEGGVNWVDLEGSREGERCRIQKKDSKFVVEKGYEKYPIIYVSWYGAKAYCKWLSEETGKNYRLPSEAEWEYAAGNGRKHTKYSWGDGTPSGKDGGNVADETAKEKFSDWTIFEGYKDGHIYTAPVGSYNPNELGIYDMSGNVWEWCEDNWHSDYKGAPNNGTAWVSAGENYPILRGGSWYNDDYYCRVALRSSPYPTNRENYGGFRVARDD